MRAEVPALLSHHSLCWWPPHSPWAGRVQRMAQPEKQHFSCREQSLSWVQESVSVHGSDGCCGLTFGHSPGLSEGAGGGTTLYCRHLLFCSLGVP